MKKKSKLVYLVVITIIVIVAIVILALASFDYCPSESEKVYGFFCKSLDWEEVVPSCGDGICTSGEECEKGGLCIYSCPEDCKNIDINTNTAITPIEDCTYYFDGCNICAKDPDGVVGCTATYCEPGEYEPYKCFDDDTNNVTIETKIQFPDTEIGVSCTDIEDCRIVDTKESVGDCCPTPDCRNWYVNDEYVAVNSELYNQQRLELMQENNCAVTECPQYSSAYCPSGEPFAYADCVDNVCVKVKYE
ncbi:MAG: hypothetical protein ACNFW9_00730 [Candidatus Kerfeldbacteria bacterium]